MDQTVKSATTAIETILMPVPMTAKMRDAVMASSDRVRRAMEARAARTIVPVKPNVETVKSKHEECDDGNQNDGDGCSRNCLPVPIAT